MRHTYTSRAAGRRRRRRARPSGGGHGTHRCACVCAIVVSVRSRARARAGVVLVDVCMCGLWWWWQGKGKGVVDGRACGPCGGQHETVVVTGQGLFSSSRFVDVGACELRWWKGKGGGRCRRAYVRAMVCVRRRGRGGGPRARVRACVVVVSLWAAGSRVVVTVVPLGGRWVLSFA